MFVWGAYRTFSLTCEKNITLTFSGKHAKFQITVTTSFNFRLTSLEVLPDALRATHTGPASPGPPPPLSQQWQPQETCYPDIKQGIGLDPKPAQLLPTQGEAGTGLYCTLSWHPRECLLRALGIWWGFPMRRKVVDYRCQELRQNQMTMPAERNKMIRNLFIKNWC